MVRAGVFSDLLSLAQGLHLLTSFVAGVLFTSMFTIAPASIAFAEIGNPSNILAISLAGALGAVCGDMLLFLFIRDTVVEDLKTVLKASSYKKFVAHFHGGFLRWISPIIGAFLIASPFPDELGLALMGFARIRSAYMIPLTFIMNFVGIWTVITVAGLF